MTKHFLAGLTLCLSAVSLSACGPAQEESAKDPDTIAGLTIDNIRLVLPPVAGNPAAVYFDLEYSGETELSVEAVAVEGAERTMMHHYAEQDGTLQMVAMDSVPLTTNTKIMFAPGGKHIMAMGLSPELMAGGTTEVTVIVSTGDKQSMPAKILAAGDDRSHKH